jgi:phospholipase/carboxylesterase
MAEGSRNPLSPTATAGRLTARPELPTGTGPRGEQPLRLDGRRDGLLYVPESYRADQPAPLVLALHGAGGNSHHGMAPFRPLADQAGLLVLAPESRKSTWDVIAGGGYGPDATFLDQALAKVFERYAVDPRRLAIGGFSDGASYALSLGLANGDLFNHIVAFSPGFASPPVQEGAPRIYISHGASDNVLPIDVCSRRLVPRLRRAGYEVVYREFADGHVVPPAIVSEAFGWFLGTAASNQTG